MQQVLQTIVNPIKLSHYDLLTTYSSCPQPHKSSQSLRHLPHSHFFFCTTLAVRFRLDEDAMTDLAIQRHAIKAMQPPPPPVSVRFTPVLLKQEQKCHSQFSLS
eukprot:m.123278 g.123278  ORF g.123278 m.123278 type:complete len:104 (-) comp13749_c0_seq1:846-1157(-)